MSNIRLDTILMVVLFVATSGFAMAQIFDHLERSYLFIISGSRTRLLAARVGVWGIAILVSLGIWGILFMVLPWFAALALFFGFEAIVLDVCTQRIQYQRLLEMEIGTASPVTCQTASGAF